MDILWSSGVDVSGYSNCARSYIKALHANPASNVFINIKNIAANINLEGIDSKELKFLFSRSRNDIKSFKYFVQHSVPDRFVIGDFNVGYTMTEMIPPDRWSYICNKFDLIMTASEFSKEKMIEGKIKESKIKVVPHCHDIKIWNKNVKPLKLDNLKDFNFLFIGDYTPRKNGDLLIKAFAKAFAGNKNVSLTIKSYYDSFSKENQHKLIKRIKEIAYSSGVGVDKIPAILFYGEPINESTMPKFMQAFDCLVSPHRCEGWGLNLSQMMFLGKPVIGTNYSGNLQFMNDGNSYLVDILGFEKVCSEMVKINPNFKDREWCIVSEEDLIEKMRFVYKNYGEAMKKAEIGYTEVRKAYCNQIISSRIIEVLSA
jgi:glycosyltransferase involved in cell wall biosynthesis